MMSGAHAPVFEMDMPKFVPSKRMCITVTMAAIITMVLVATFAWGHYL